MEQEAQAMTGVLPATRCTEELDEAVRRLARRQGVTVSVVIREAVQKYVLDAHVEAVQKGERGVVSGD